MNGSGNDRRSDQERAQRLGLSVERIYEIAREKPLYLQDIEERARRYGEEPAMVSARDREILNQPAYPGADCLKPEEVEMAVSGGTAMTANRRAHAHTCLYCHALAVTARPDRMRISRMAVQAAEFEHAQDRRSAPAAVGFAPAIATGSVGRFFNNFLAAIAGALTTALAFVVLLVSRQSITHQAFMAKDKGVPPNELSASGWHLSGAPYGRSDSAQVAVEIDDKPVGSLREFVGEMQRDKPTRTLSIREGDSQQDFVVEWREASYHDPSAKRSGSDAALPK